MSDVHYFWFRLVFSSTIISILSYGCMIGITYLTMDMVVWMWLDFRTTMILGLNINKNIFLKHNGFFMLVVDVYVYVVVWIVFHSNSFNI